MDVRKWGLQTGEGEYHISNPVCIQLICLSEEPVHGWVSMACVKWRADFTPLPRGQRSICWAATVGDIKCHPNHPDQVASDGKYPIILKINSKPALSPRCSQAKNLGGQALRDTEPHFSLCKTSTQGFWESIIVFSLDMDYSLFRRALLAMPNLSKNLIYQQNHFTIISNLSVLRKAKVLFCCLSLIMFSEPCHGGSDEILALCARKSHHICIYLTEALISSNM